MARFLVYWTVLAAVHAVAVLAVSFLGFARIDLRYGAYAQLILIPTVQTVVLLWATGRWSVAGCVGMLRVIVRRRLPMVILLADAVLLISGWMLSARPLPGISAPGGAVVTWTAVKALLAAVALAWLLVVRPFGVAGRVAVALLAVLAAALASLPVTGWLGALDRIMVSLLPRVMRWLVAYGGVFTIGVALALAAGSAMGRLGRTAAFALDVAVALCFAVAVIVALGYFQRPFLVQPWLGVVRGGLSLAATWVLLAPLLALDGVGADRA